MKKNSRKFLLFLALLLAFTVVRLPYQHLGSMIYDRIRAQLAQNNISLSAREAKLSFPAILTFSEAKLGFPRARLSFPSSSDSKLFIEEANFELKLLPLALLNQQLEASFRTLGGAGTFSLSKAIFNDSRSAKFYIEKLNLSKLPNPLEGNLDGELTITGDLSGDSPLANKAELILLEEAGTLDVSLDKASYSGGDKVGGLIVLPSAENVKLDSKISLDKGLLTIDYLSLFSSLGSVKGQGTLKLNKGGNLDSSDLQLEIDLTEVGAKHFAGYLALAANISPDTKAKKWALSISKSSRSSVPTVKAKIR